MDRVRIRTSLDFQISGKTIKSLKAYFPRLLKFPLAFHTTNSQKKVICAAVTQTLLPGATKAATLKKGNFEKRTTIQQAAFSLLLLCIFHILAFNTTKVF